MKTSNAYRLKREGRVGTEVARQRAIDDRLFILKHDQRIDRERIRKAKDAVKPQVWRDKQ